ncbi:Uncharacterised protein [Mobiluncus mulieris]|nr:Uncharacterised protein [Mobiluncus mulieris]
MKGRKYIGSPQKYYFEDVGLRNARLNFRQVEENHLMENIIYKRTAPAGFLGRCRLRRETGSSRWQSHTEKPRGRFRGKSGFAALLPAIGLAYPGLGKERQEKAPLVEVPDSFKKILLVRDTVKPTYDQHGILTMSVLDFLLNPNSLD